MLHMAPDITSGPRGSISSGDTPTTRGSPSPLAAREWNASTALESPRTPAWPPRVCFNSPRSSLGALPSPKKLSFSPATRRPVSPDAHRLRGPARFFYDRSTWTGCQANALAADAEHAGSRDAARGVKRSPRLAAPGPKAVSLDPSFGMERRPVIRPHRRTAEEQEAESPDF